MFDRKNNINSASTISKELNFLFKGSEPMIIFDIGACEGESSIQYSRLFPKSTIYAFEPLPENVQLIQDNFKTYKIGNALCFNKAMSSENGTAEFFVSSGNPKTDEILDWDFGNKSSSLLSPDKHLDMFGFLHFNKKIEVETITLKDFCNSRNIKCIDFIHMDVQGAELMVLEGAADFISSIKAIWLEVSKVQFYKGQPLVDDVRKFMVFNNFILLKNELNGEQGDQLYVSKNCFPKSKLLILKNWILTKHLISKFLRIMKLNKLMQILKSNKSNATI